MSLHDGQVAPTAKAPATSLRRRWRLSLAVFLTVFTVSGIANFVGTRATSGAFRHVAVRMENDATVLSSLRTDIVATALLRSAAVQHVGQGQTQLDAAVTTERAAFRHTISALRPGGGREIIEHEFALSQDLWPADMSTVSPLDFLAKSAQGRSNFAMIDEAAAASRTQARADLAQAATFERNMTVAVALTSLVLVALVIGFARGLAREVLHPVARLRESAGRLAGGDLDHRVEVARDDELGDLAATFNAMADVVARSYRDLTLQASRDALTGLANRTAFYARLQDSLAGPERRDSTQAVVFVDVDDFKDVNDELGHATGDNVLCAVAVRLTEAVRPGDLVARLGGDEFALLLDGVAGPEAALAIAERAVAAIAGPVELRGAGVRVKASVRVSATAGVAMRHDSSDPDSLMREADVAMYAAKGQGKNRVHRYGTSVDEAGNPTAGTTGIPEMRNVVPASSGSGSL